MRKRNVPPKNSKQSKNRSSKLKKKEKRNSNQTRTQGKFNKLSLFILKQITFLTIKEVLLEFIKALT